MGPWPLIRRPSSTIAGSPGRGGDRRRALDPVVGPERRCRRTSRHRPRDATLPIGLAAGHDGRCHPRAERPDVSGDYLLVLDVVTPERGSLIASGADPTLVRVTVVAALESKAGREPPDNPRARRARLAPALARPQAPAVPPDAADSSTSWRMAPAQGRHSPPPDHASRSRGASTGPSIPPTAIRIRALRRHVPGICCWEQHEPR